MVNFLHPRRRRPAEPLWLFTRSHEPCARGGVAPENPDFEHGGGVAMRGRLNAFFAISVNSPAMRMVNFSRCVGSALRSGARSVSRRVNPQPTSAAGPMETGGHGFLL